MNDGASFSAEESTWFGVATEDTLRIMEVIIFPGKAGVDLDGSQSFSPPQRRATKQRDSCFLIPTVKLDDQTKLAGRAMVSRL